MDFKRPELESYWKVFFLMRWKRSNLSGILWDFISLFQLLMIVNDFKTMEDILRLFPLRMTWLIDSMMCKSDTAFNLTQPFVDSSIFDDSNSPHGQINRALQFGVQKGDIGIVSMSTDALRKRSWEYEGPSLLLAAVVYNQPERLEIILPKNSLDEKTVKILNFIRCFGGTWSQMLLWSPHGPWM